MCVTTVFRIYLPRECGTCVCVCACMCVCSILVGCHAHQTYLRLSGKSFSVERVQTASVSPTGRLPALSDSSAAASDDERGHATVSAALASVSGGTLEAGKKLRSAQAKATAAAFKAMAERCLVPASVRCRHFLMSIALPQHHHSHKTISHATMCHLCSFACTD